MSDVEKNWFASRVLGIEESITIATSARAGQLRREGIDIISLSAGEPDFDTPGNIKEAALEAIKDGKTKYTQPASGIPELKEAICDKLKQDNGLSYDPPQIVVACGAKQVIFDAIMTLIEDGDEAIIPAPYWVSYADQVKLFDGKPVIVETTAESGFRISPEQLQNAITPKTKFVLFNSPNNPTGEVYTRDQLQKLANVIADAGIFVISDEIYEKIIYDGLEHVSIPSLNPELMDKSLVVNGLSKAYAMTGWRVGYGAGPPNLMKLIAKVQSQETTNTCSISQYAALEALRGPQASVEMMRQAFEERREVVVNGLNQISGIACRKPQGAFYVFPDVSELYGRSDGKTVIQNDVDFCEFLLNRARVAGVPGSGFGADAHIRLSYATSTELIEGALDRIEKAVGQLEPA